MVETADLGLNGDRSVKEERVNGEVVNWLRLVVIKVVVIKNC